MEAETTKAGPGVDGVRLVTGAMLAGLTLFTLVALFLSRDGGIGSADDAHVFRLILLALGVGTFLGTAALSRSMREAQRTGAELEENSSLRLKLMKAASAEGFGLLGAVFLLLTGDIYLLAAPLISALILLTLLSVPAEVASLPGNSDETRSAGDPPIEP
jgi:hypothetical protein